MWDYIRKAGFLGMIIDKKYGGKSFSAHGHALVVQKISTRSQSVGVSVMVRHNILRYFDLVLRHFSLLLSWRVKYVGSYLPAPIAVPLMIVSNHVQPYEMYYDDSHVFDN